MECNLFFCSSLGIVEAIFQSWNHHWTIGFIIEIILNYVVGVLLEHFFQPPYQANKSEKGMN